MGMPTVKSWPSFFRLATRASTFSWAAPSLKISRFRAPVSGPRGPAAAAAGAVRDEREQALPDSRTDQAKKPPEPEQKAEDNGGEEADSHD